MGAPGVGKTSLGKSIANATGRKFVRLALGGVHDEAEIRGHRRTYIGALPGQIVQLMKRAGTINPVILLDEVDKLGRDFRGDPSAALLEVLDPEQNCTFRDHYLDVDYDLSHVFFIATANVLHTIPPALQDRLEILNLAGYTEREKLEIAKRHLIPKQCENSGLDPEKVKFTDDGILETIRHYTREAGVRNLEREIGSCLRKIARKFVISDTKDDFRVVIDAEKVQELLGTIRFRKQDIARKSEIGLVNGLAWTEVGGDVLQVEATLVKGKGEVTLTGKLGEVMQESARAALTCVRSRAESLGINPDDFREKDLHIHVPEGAIPKDGPSAGITMATAMVSALTRKRARHDVAMQAQLFAPKSSRPLVAPEREGPEMADKQQNPDARAVPRWPYTKSTGRLDPSTGLSLLQSSLAPQTIGLNFDTVTGPTETGAFPPDTMAAAGPSQIVLFVNGRIRTFNKLTGAADGVMNFDPDVFFAPVMTAVAPPVVLNFTSDPQVRYDRLSGRWFLSIIDVPW